MSIGFAGTFSPSIGVSVDSIATQESLRRSIADLSRKGHGSLKVVPDTESPRVLNIEKQVASVACHVCATSARIHQSRNVERSADSEWSPNLEHLLCKVGTWREKDSAWLCGPSCERRHMSRLGDLAVSAEEQEAVRHGLLFAPDRDNADRPDGREHRVATVVCHFCSGNTRVHQSRASTSDVWGPDVVRQLSTFGWIMRADTHGEHWFCGKTCETRDGLRTRDHGREPLPVATRVTGPAPARNLYATPPTAEADPKPTTDTNAARTKQHPQNQNQPRPRA